MEKTMKKTYKILKRFIRITKDNRGVALIIVLMLLLIASALTVGFIISTDIENRVSQNQIDSIQAQYMSEAGIAYAFNKIRTGTWLLDVNGNYYWGDEDYFDIPDPYDPNHCYNITRPDKLGHFIHDYVNFPAVFPPTKYPTLSNDVDAIWEELYNLPVQYPPGRPPCGFREDFPLYTGFRIWAEQDNPNFNKWRLISIGFSNNTTYTTVVEFRTIPQMTQFAIAGDKYVAIVPFGGRTNNSVGRCVSYITNKQYPSTNQGRFGGIWSNGELHIDFGTFIDIDTNGSDNILGPHPVTGVCDDAFIGSLGHFTCGGLIATRFANEDAYVFASSGDTYGLDQFGPNNVWRCNESFRPPNIPQGIGGAVRGVLFLRNGFSLYDRFGQPRLNQLKERDYKLAMIWGGGATNFRENPLCFNYLINPPMPYSRDCYVQFLNGEDVLKHFLSPTPVVYSPTPTPQGQPTPTPAFDRVYPNSIPDQDMCVQVAYSLSPTPTPQFAGYWKNTDHFNRYYCAKAEREAGVSNASCPGYPNVYDSPYLAHDNSLNYVNFRSVNNTYADYNNPQLSDFFLDPTWEYSKVLVNYDKGNMYIDYYDDTNQENWYIKVAKQLGTFFYTWDDFSIYVRDSSNPYINYDLNTNTMTIGDPNWVPEDHNGYPLIFYVKAKVGEYPAHGFISLNMNVRFYGHLMTGGTIDIRDWGKHVRKRTPTRGAVYRCYTWWPGRGPTYPPNPPNSPEYIVSIDGVNTLYISTPLKSASITNVKFPVLAAAGDILIMNRKFTTEIHGLIYAKGTVWFDNPYPPGDPTVEPYMRVYQVKVKGAIIADQVYLYRSFMVQYDPDVRENINIVEYTPRYFEILNVERGAYLNEAPYM